MCGTVSFKRGDYFYQKNKVSFHQYGPNRYLATITGEEDFHVTVETDSNGDIQTTCSCPKLASFDKDCQHIAAVLLAIYDHQRKGTVPLIVTNTNQELTKGLLNLFTEKTVRTSGHQRHFENRQVLMVEFTCKPVKKEDGRYLIGIEMNVESSAVENIRDLLINVWEGKTSLLSHSFTYDPSLHCFQQETDAVIQQLIQVLRDEKVFATTVPDTNRMLTIPSSAWERLLPLLVKAPQVKLMVADQSFAGLTITDDSLPLQFDFTFDQGKGYQLKVTGFQQMVVLEAYQSILFDGKIKRLDPQDFQRLLDLRQMLIASVPDQIQIPQQQIRFFLEKVVPGLKKLGQVTIAEAISSQLMSTPLVAKLYLDRVKNRLLAGLEFHYGHIIIHPLDNREIPTESLLIRDMEKEEKILQIMEDSSFAKTDGGYFLHNEELEYEFLVHVVPKLQKLVQMYATTAVRNRIFRENARPQIRVKVKKERTNWLEFKFEMDGIPERQIREVL